MEYTPDPNNVRVDAMIGTQRPPLEATIERFEDLQELRTRWAAVEAIPVLAESREDGIDHTWGPLDIRTLLRGEQSGGRFSAHNVVLAPGTALSPHYHLDAHAYLLVIEGEVDLQIGATVERVGPNSLGYAPPMTRIGFANRSAAPAMLALAYTPAGVDRAFEAAHQQWSATGSTTEADYQAILATYGFRFDGEPLANDDRTNQTEPPLEFEFTGGDDLDKLRQAMFARPAVPKLVPTAREEYAGPSEERQIRKQLLKGDDSGGTAMMNMVSMSPGPGAPPHHQPTEDEFFFITNGPAQMTCGAATKPVGTGAVAFCPRNCTHSFGNPDPEERCQFVTLNSPAGHERALLAVGKAAGEGATPEQLHQLSIDGGFLFHVPIGIG